MYLKNIVKAAKENTYFRRVMYTGKNSQLVLMCIPPKGEIGDEVHPMTDQILFFVVGSGEAIVAGESDKICEGDVVFVPANTEHNFKNTGKTDMKLYTVYAPPAHKDKTIEKTKDDVEKDEII